MHPLVVFALAALGDAVDDEEEATRRLPSEGVRVLASGDPFDEPPLQVQVQPLGLIRAAFRGRAVSPLAFGKANSMA